MRYLGIFLAVLIGLPIIRFSYATTWLPGLTPGGRLFFAVVLLVTVLAVILTHELGHLLGGRMVGFRFRLLAIGPVRVYRANGGIRVGLNRNLWHVAGVAGSSPEVPTGMRRRMALVLAAGPIASLLAGGIALALMLADVPDQITRTWFAEFSLSRANALFAAGSLAVGIITLLPGGSRERPTDGSRILELLGRGPEADRAAAILSLNSLSLAGKTPDSWPASLLESALSPSDGSPDEVRALLLAHSAATARRDRGRARALIERALEVDAPARLRDEVLARARMEEAAGEQASGDVARSVDEPATAGTGGTRHGRESTDQSPRTAEPTSQPEDP